MIRGIFFDAAGVFYDRRETTSQVATRLVRELGFKNELSEEQRARKKQIHVLATEGRISHETYWDEILMMYGLCEPEPRGAIRKQVLDHTFEVFAYPGGREAMAGLQARGFKLGIVTDTIYPVQWKMAWLEKVGVAEYIQVVACSTELGAHKPEPEMYLHAVEHAQLTVAESAFVGHDAVELEGARRAGLGTVAVNYDPGAQADYYAGSLLGLLNIPIFQVVRGEEK